MISAPEAYKSEVMKKSNQIKKLQAKLKDERLAMSGSSTAAQETRTKRNLSTNAAPQKPSLPQIRRITDSERQKGKTDLGPNLLKKGRELPPV